MVVFNSIDFNDGDIILFGGKKSLISKCIEYCTNSIYSHIGIVLKDPKFTHPPLKGLYLLESSYMKYPDAENHRSNFGVHISNLDDIIANYTGDLYYRKLNCIRDATFYENLAEAHSHVHNLPYNINIFDWIKAKFNIEVGDVQKLDTFWCSALASYVYVQLGLLDSDTLWTIDSPKEWGSEDVKNSSVQFINCNLEQEEKILF
jgi:hypothetical protein